MTGKYNARDSKSQEAEDMQTKPRFFTAQMKEQLLFSLLSLLKNVAFAANDQMIYSE